MRRGTGPPSVSSLLLGFASGLPPVTARELNTCPAQTKTMKKGHMGETAKPTHRSRSPGHGPELLQNFLLQPASHGGPSCVHSAFHPSLWPTPPFGHHSYLEASIFLVEKKHLSLIHVSRRKATQYLILIECATFFFPCQEITLQLCIIYWSGQDLHRF